MLKWTCRSGTLISFGCCCDDEIPICGLFGFVYKLPCTITNADTNACARHLFLREVATYDMSQNALLSQCNIEQDLDI